MCVSKIQDPSKSTKIRWYRFPSIPSKRSPRKFKSQSSGNEEGKHLMNPAREWRRWRDTPPCPAPAPGPAPASGSSRTLIWRELKSTPASASEVPLPLRQLSNHRVSRWHESAYVRCRPLFDTYIPADYPSDMTRDSWVRERSCSLQFAHKWHRHRRGAGVAIRFGFNINH